MIMSNLKIIESDIFGSYKTSDFEDEVSGYLKEGYKISSTNCCVVGANDEGSFSRYQAILIKD